MLLFLLGFPCSFQLGRAFFSEAGNISLCWRTAKEMWGLYLPCSSCWEWHKVGLEYFFSVIMGYFVLHYILSLPILLAL